MDLAWRGRIADLERTGTAAGRAGLGAFGIEGYRAHERALAAGRVPRWSLVGASLLAGTAESRGCELLEQLRAADVPITGIPDSVFLEMTGGRELGPVASLVDFPESQDLDALLSRARVTDRLLVGISVEDPGNVGALVRTSLAGGALAYVRVGSGDPFHPRAVRTSMGSLFRIPVLEATIDQWVAACRRQGIPTVGAVCRGGRPLTRMDWPVGPVAIAVGSEAFGLSAEVREMLDVEVTIPMRAAVDSYSVNAAAAILLWEHQRSTARPGI